jgi:Spy/CpxP family protein refolding chaperone
MKTAFRTLFTLMLAACIAAPLLAADGKEKKKGGKKKGRRVPTAVQVPKTIDLTAEQKTTLAAINKEYGPKFLEALKQRDGILTADQKKARAAAFKANREAKRQGKEAREAVSAAIDLTDEQKQAYKKAQKAVAAIRKEARGKFLAVLTPEQRKKLSGPRKRAGNKKKNPNAKKNNPKKNKKKADK